MPTTLLERTHPTGSTAAEATADWSSELANLLLGRLKSRLITHGVTIELSTPITVSATAFRFARFSGVPVVHESAAIPPASSSRSKARAHIVVPVVQRRHHEVNPASLKETTVKKTIIVVDDSQTAHRQVCMALAEEDYEIVEAVDGLSKIVAHADASLVICDVNMPNMNGLEMLRALRADHPTYESRSSC